MGGWMGEYRWVDMGRYGWVDMDGWIWVVMDGWIWVYIGAYGWVGGWMWVDPLFDEEEDFKEVLYVFDFHASNKSQNKCSQINFSQKKVKLKNSWNWKRIPGRTNSSQEGVQRKVI